MRYLITLFALFSMLNSLEASFVSEKDSSRRYYFEQFANAGEMYRQNIDWISQDQEGLLYLCTQTGLDVFNGSSFTRYNQETHPDFSNKINCVIPLDSERLIIGTSNKGLFILDKRKESLYHLDCILEENGHYPHILCLFEDMREQIWIGGTDGFLVMVEKSRLLSCNNKEAVSFINVSISGGPTVNAFSQWGDQILVASDHTELLALSQENPESGTKKIFSLGSSHHQILSLKTNRDLILAGTSNGLVIMKNNKSSDDLYIDRHFFKGSTISSIEIQGADQYWIGSIRDGLFRLSMENQLYKWEQFLYDPYTKESINSNSIISLFVDNYENLWIGTWFGGLNRTKLEAPTFQNIFSSNNENEIQRNIVWSIEKSSMGYYWLGNHAYGLNRWMNGEDNFGILLNDEIIHSIQKILEIKPRNMLFIGTWGNGLHILDPLSLNKQFEYRHIFKPLENDRIYSMVKDENDFVWIGSYYNGLHRYDLDKNVMTKISIQGSTGIKGSEIDVRCMFVDNGKLWLGSYHNGLFVTRLTPDGQVTGFEQIQTENSSLKPLSVMDILRVQDRILCMTEDGAFWVNNDNKLSRALPKMKEKLCTNALLDEENNLWITTYNGLYRYSLTDSSVTDFHSNVKFHKIIYDAEQQKMIACSSSGLFIFNPKQLFNMNYTPEIHISGLRIFDLPVSPGEMVQGETIITESLNYLDTLILPYFCNIFSFDLETISMKNEHQNQILYQMEGVDPSWIRRSSAKARASYTNIPAGEYRFSVKVRDLKSLQESNVKTLTIIKLRPFWATTLAYLVYAVIFLLIAVFIFRIIRSRIMIKNELKVEKLSKLKEEELHQQKLVFFTNISHELVTPLTLITTPLEEVAQLSSGNQKVLPFLKTIQNNTKLLNRLIDQILDFRKIEGGAMRLQLQRVNLIPFLREIINQFREAADRQQIDVEIESGEEEIWWPFDPHKLESILFNVISNSLKFTPEYGAISIRVESTGDTLVLEIQDTGIGIKKDDIPHIFDRFYQSPNTTNQKGTGIGLSMVKKYVELHNGSIHVQSEPGSGTLMSFRFELPKDSDIGSLSVFDPGMKISSSNQFPDNKIKAKAGLQKKSILVVEDNPEMLVWITNLLRENYRVYEANNGDTGYELAIKHNLDLVITDVMMDGMNGFELCQKIKSNLLTSHLPVILLTAMRGVEARIEGIETGADAFIEKPFNLKLLLTRVVKLIEHREKLKAKYSMNLDTREEPCPSSLDQEFMKKIIAIVEAQIQNPQLTVDSVAKEMHLSQDQFYRKIKILTGLSANQFIRTLRLKKAIVLLRQQDYNVSEIGYLVGFNSPSYFAKCFKEEFGMSPSEF